MVNWEVIQKITEENLRKKGKPMNIMFHCFVIFSYIFIITQLHFEYAGTTQALPWKKELGKTCYILI